jgi:acetylornithine deacetylase
VSGSEDKTAELIGHFLQEQGIAHQRKHNNIYAYHPRNREGRPLVLLNSHHDTVAPVPGWQHNPHSATEEDGRLYGLGSNDAGASACALLAVFAELAREDLPYNLAIAITAEEEKPAGKGIECLLDEFKDTALGIVGEPTGMQMAVAEKGLIVLDCYAHGKSGHAARDEGENAIYNALRDIEWFRDYEFPKVSSHLGKVKMSVTQIDAGKQHNVVPGTCHFVVDVRVTDRYSLQEVFDIIDRNTSCEVKYRAIRCHPSGIAMDHPVVKAALGMGLSYYGSPTSSDQALMPFNTVKIGPGQSARSHTADEYIELRELKEGIDIYYKLLKKLVL